MKKRGKQNMKITTFKNCRVSFELFSKMLREKMTAAEILTIIYLSKIQKEDGTVEAVHYNDLRDAYAHLGKRFTHKTFYETMHSLEYKKIIKAFQTGRGDWNVKLVDNDFTFENQSDMKNSQKEDGTVADLRYILVNAAMFSSKEFVNLSPLEMLVAMDWYKQCRATSAVSSDNGTISYRKVNLVASYEKMGAYSKDGKQLKISTLIHVIAKLKSLFYINFKDGVYKIQIRNDMKLKTYKSSPVEKLAGSYAKILFRRIGLNKEKNAKNDMANMIEMVMKRASKVDCKILLDLLRRLEHIITECFTEINQNLPKSKWFNRNWNAYKRIITKRIWKNVGKDIWEDCVANI